MRPAVWALAPLFPAAPLAFVQAPRAAQVSWVLTSVPETDSGRRRQRKTKIADGLKEQAGIDAQCSKCEWRADDEKLRDGANGVTRCKTSAFDLASGHSIAA